MAGRPCGEECPIGKVGRGRGSMMERYNALVAVIGKTGNVVCWGAGATVDASGERGMLLCFCREGEEPERFGVSCRQMAQLARKLLCALMMHQGQVAETELLKKSLAGEAGAGGEGEGPH